ncbi:type VI immunity family protein [Archangium lansingense]|uniref:type VI immunity family protein n=1 Tax=Archangium lansingense TaxID=2995310 RepID=UPI003B79AE81
MMSDHYPRVRLYSVLGGERHSLYIRESVSITFYMRRSHREIIQQVMRCLEVYLRAIGPQVLGWYVDPYSGDWEELDDKGWAFLRREMFDEPIAQVWLREFAGATTGYEVLYHGRLLEKNVTSALSFILPTEYLEAHGPGRVRELALELAAELPFSSGHGGLCFNFPESVLGTTGAIRDMSFRYPGLDIPGVHFDSLSIGTRVKGVHWLNFLGQPVLGALGGAAGLRERLRSPDTTVQELDGERAVVTLGEWPEAGDLEQGRTLPDYRELAHVLEPWLYMDRGNWSGFSDEDMRRWERRFLD